MGRIAAVAVLGALMADLNQLLFDRLIYVDRLKRAGIDEAQARAHADALNEALRDAVATKHDIEQLAVATKHDIELLERSMERLEHKIESATLKLTIRFGGMAVAAVAAVISS